MTNAQNSSGKEKPNFADDLCKIVILSFASYRKALLYAGFKEDMFNNWSLAASFARAHNMVPIHVTEGGKYLAVPHRKNELHYTFEQFQRVWDRASIKYSLNIEGAVKTFVCGAAMDSTFRRKEIPAMLRSRTIGDINGCGHADYVRLRRAVLARLNDEAVLPQKWRHRLSINAVFRKMALAEIRQDRAIARGRGDVEEERSVLARIGHLRWRHRIEMRRVPRSREQQRLNEALLAQEEMTRANPGFPFAAPRHTHG
jgi:hypothetical protein